MVINSIRRSVHDLRELQAKNKPEIDQLVVHIMHAWLVIAFRELVMINEYRVNSTKLKKN